MKIIFTIYTALFSIAAFSQSFPYNVTSFNSTYTEFSDGTSLVTGVWDDPEFLLELGFEMEILGNSVTSLDQIGLGAVFITENSPEPLFFVPYGSLLTDAGNLTGSQISTISYKLEGTENNHIGKLQYSDCAFYHELNENSTNLQRVNFQVWFYEADNSIEIRFGTHTITNPALVHDGINGPSIIFGTNIDIWGNTFDEAWVLTGSPLNPQVSEIEPNNSTTPVGLDSNPENETVIRFAPATVSVGENYAENFKVFPNPVADQLSVIVPSGKASTYKVYNSVGIVALSGNLKSVENKLELSSLAAGVYILKINGQQKKIVKQ